MKEVKLSFKGREVFAESEGETIKHLQAEDFKITIGGKKQKVTKATYNPFSGGYFLEFEETKENKT